MTDEAAVAGERQLTRPYNPVSDVPGAPARAASASAAPWVALALITALAAALRIAGLNGGLWWDEIRTLVDSVRSPLLQIVTVFPGNNQHTFFSVLAHLSVQLFGEHPWSLRLPAMLAGVATVPVLYFFAREFVSRTEALLASLLLAVAYHAVWFSQNARGYSLLALLTLTSSWLLLRGLRRGRASDFVWYGVVAALGVYTHLTMVFLVVSHAILCVIPLGLPGLGAERRRRWRLPMMGFALSAALTLLLYSPLLLDVEQFFAAAPATIEVATPKWAIGAMLRGLRLGAGSLAGVAMGGVVLLFGMRSYYKQSPFLLGLFVLPGVVTVGAAVALHRPIFPRFLYFLVGFALLIVVRGALEIGALLSSGASARPERLTWAGIGLVLLGAVVAAAPLPHDYRYPKQDFIGAMRYVDAHRAPGEPVLTVGGAMFPYREYFQRDWAFLTSADQLAAIRRQGRRVWVVYTLASYIEAEKPELMHALRSGCSVRRIFRGTVDGGSVTVCTIFAAAPTDAR